MSAITSAQRNSLFWASCIALLTTSMTFGIRGEILGSLGSEFALSPSELGWCIGTAFWGFTLAMMIGGPLVDVLGMKRIMTLAFIGHLVGVVLTITAFDFWTLFISTLFIGIANGFVEAACNPLVATLYPDQKTDKLNKFHFWFPGGIVIGGLLAYGFEQLGLGWQAKVALILIPNLAYGAMFFNKTLPVTERVAANVSTEDMFKACLQPLFIVMVLLMFLTAATELGSNQWIPSLLENAGIAGILILVLINGIMAIGRLYAGNFVHQLSTTGVLIVSAVLSTLGLYLMGTLEGGMVIAGAVVFALGVTYFWPTMLGFVATNLPKTGALGLAIMGGAGMLSVSLILPIMGGWFDSFTLAAMPEGYTIEQMGGLVEGMEDFELLQGAKLAGGKETLKYVAALPAFLILAFAGLHFFGKKKHA